MHEELDTPDAPFGWILPRLDVPGRELFGQGSDPWPVACASVFDDFGAGVAECGDFIWCQEGWDEDEAIAVKGVEIWCRHFVMVGVESEKEAWLLVPLRMRQAIDCLYQA